MLDRFLPPSGPGRTLAIISLVNTTGSGLWVTSSALSLTRFVELPATHVGIGFSVAALVCLVASTPMGYLADARGPRRQQVVFYVLLAALFGAMLLVNSLWSFILVAALTALADAGQRGARGALIAGCIPPEQRVRSRAMFRTMANVGYTLGAGTGGAAIAVGSLTAYRLMIIGNAASYLAVALLATRLPDLAPSVRAGSEPRLLSLRDRPYLLFVALDGLMSMHNDILNLVLPLWIAGHTGAPKWMAAVCIVVNTVLVVLLQVRTSRNTETIQGAVRAARAGGLLIGAACLLFALSSGRSAGPATVLLLLGAVVHVLGELRHSAAGWGLSFGLAPAERQGQYQATYAMGGQLGRIVGPAVLIWLVLGLGWPGWLGVAALVVLPAFAIRRAVDWSVRWRAAGRGEPVPGELAR
ncbi:MAG: MFS transporter [Jatrophihabitans sp.]